MTTLQPSDMQWYIGIGVRAEKFWGADVSLTDERRSRECRWGVWGHPPPGKF